MAEKNSKEQQQNNQAKPEPVYTDLTDWQAIAEKSDLEARRWGLLAELARINIALENVGGKND